MPIREVILSLADVETYIQKLESKYGLTTADFLANREQIEARIDEDDVFKWEIYIAHRRELCRINEELRQDYLSNVNWQQPAAKVPDPDDQLALAA